MSISLMCALLIEQVLSGPLASVPLETIGTCSNNRCVIYWVEQDVCEEVPAEK